MMIVNCHNVIQPERQDKELLDKMYDERQGIIYLAVRALQKVICAGLFNTLYDFFCFLLYITIAKLKFLHKGFDFFINR